MTRLLDPAAKDRLALLARAGLRLRDGLALIGHAAEPDGTRDDTAQIDRVTTAYYDEIATLCPPSADTTAALRCVRLARQVLLQAAALPATVERAGGIEVLSPVAVDQFVLSGANAREALSNCDPSALPPIPTQE